MAEANRRKLRTQLREKAPNRILEIRHTNSIRLGDLANALGTSQSQIGRFEKGERALDIPWGRRIAEVLNVSFGDLLAPEDNPYAARTESERVVLNAMRSDIRIADLIRASAEGLTQFVAPEIK